MAINVSFNGATIYKPGAYSKVSIDLGGGFPLSPTGIVAIFGEAEAGAPGSNVTSIANNVFSPEQLPLIKSTYRNGPLVDACNFLFAPGADGAIPGGAQAVYIYKTNASVRASLALAASYGTLRALEWGVGGNKLTYKNVLVPAASATTSSSAPFNITAAPFATGGGSPHLNDADAIAAKAAAQSAYTSLTGMSATPISATLDGQVLTPGVYSTGAATLAGSGAANLTFNGAGVYVIQCASTLTTGAGGVPTMTLSGGATAANIYFTCGSSATINSGFSGTFQGNIIASASVTDTLGGTVNGSLIGLSGSVTLSAAASVVAQNAPLLGVAGAYGLLAGASVTNTGASNINGKVGTSPGTSVTGFPPGMITGAGGILSFVLRIQGADAAADNTFTLPAVSTRAAFQSALNLAGNWSGGLPSGVTFTIGGLSDSAATFTATRSATGTPNTEGFGRNFELVSGALLAAVNVSAGLVVAGAENQAMITISNKRDLTSESASVGGTIVIKIGRQNPGAVSPKVTVNATQILLINNSVNEYALNLADFNTLSELAAFISSSTGGNWMAAVGSNLYGQLPLSVMDKVVNLGAQATSLSAALLPAQIKKDAKDIHDFFAASASVEMLNQALLGLPNASAETYLAGGALGASQTADMANALSAFTKIRVNSVVPLFSRDATADKADALTDPASSYTILGIHQSVKTHCSLMATTKNKSERQGYLSLKDSYAACKNESQNLADARQQLVIQDVRQADSNGAIKWFQPWAAACMLAGARGGSPIGLPMTGKYFNMSGIRHTAQPMSTAEQDIVIDFDPDTQYDDAIANNLTFWEHPQSGGFRLIVDNTTYGKDGNWVYNRANVLYAADVLAYDFRNQLQNIYVGVKNTVAAAEVKSTCESILATYLAQGITVSTQDAKNGFKQLVVQINGNVINISVVVKLVEGIDFILADITLQRASQTA